MRRHTKYIVGFAGLAVVGIMTAIAANLPGPEAQAATDAGTGVQVQVVEAPLEVSVTGEDEQGNPILNVGYEANVCKVNIQATKIDTGDVLFHPEITKVIRVVSSNTDKTRMISNVSGAGNASATSNATAGSFSMTLPFAENGAAVGDYYISVSACGCDGSALGMKKIQYYYGGAKTPAVPNTGEINLFGTNLARADYIAVGLLILAAAGACIVLAVRKKHQQRK